MSEAGSREGFDSPPWDPAGNPPAWQDDDSLRTTRAELAAPARHDDDSLRTTRAELGGPAWREALSQPPPTQPSTTGQGGAGAGSEGNPGHGSRGRHRAQPGNRAKPATHAKRNRNLWRELPVLVVIALALALTVKTYVIQAFYIPSGSMQNTLAIGDRVLINKVVYHTRGIDRGDIVVFNGQGSWDPETAGAPSDPFVRFFDAVEGVVGITHGSDIYIKRVIGLPGDHVRCCDTQGRITVNGVPLTEQSYLFPGNSPSAQAFSVTVPPGSLWVMGDHRAVSYDSRGHLGDPGGGAIPENAVIGRAFVIIWPPSRWGSLDIPATFEQPQLTGSAAAAGGSPAALATALDTRSVRLQSSWTPLPLALGAAGAVPLTWAQRRLRRRLARRRSRSHEGRTTITS
jgi:signal peptidase I